MPHNITVSIYSQGSIISNTSSQLSEVISFLYGKPSLHQNKPIKEVELTTAVQTNAYGGKEPLKRQDG